MNFNVYIPVRYGATRLPGKPLLEIRGKPLLQHVFERALESGAAEVVIATDDERIADAASAFGAEVCMTAGTHESGTDRIAEAAAKRGELPERIIVNVQGDEPQIPAAVIRQVASLVESRPCELASVCEPLAAAQIFDTDVVKVVRGVGDRALYFSRAPIPWDRERFSNERPTDADADHYRRHVGIYGFRARYLTDFVAMPRNPLEALERLEQLRALAAGARVLVADAVEPCGRGIDTEADLALARAS